MGLKVVAFPFLFVAAISAQALGPSAFIPAERGPIPSGWEARPAPNGRTTALTLGILDGRPVVHLKDEDPKEGVGMGRWVAVLPGHRYRQSVSVKGGGLALFFNWYDAKRGFLAPERVKGLSGNPDGFRTQAFEELAPSNAAWCLAWLYSSTGNRGEAWIGGWQMDDLGLPPEPAKTAGPAAFLPPVPAPTARQFLASVKDVHPRLMLTPSRLARIRELLKTDRVAAGWWDKTRQGADRLLAEPAARYEIPDGLRLLETSKKVERRMIALGLAWRITGEARYVDRAAAELRAVCAFPDWNPRHFLDTAEMALAVAIGYDWCYDGLSAADRTLAAESIVRLGLDPGIKALEEGKAFWARANNNWNVICNGGLSVAALAVAPSHPAAAARILPAAFSNVQWMLPQFEPDGAWFEGTGYWWGTVKYTIDYAASLESACGSDFGLLSGGAFPGFWKTGAFPTFLVSPSRRSFNYSDSGEKPPSLPELFWLAAKTGQALYQDYALTYASATADELLFYEPMKADGRPLPLDRHFRGVEVATLRGSWADPLAAFVGLKAGDNRAPHGHLDLGSVILEALGERWAIDIEGENYNAPGVFGADRWKYYRLKTEGHNTLSIDPARHDGGNQDPGAKASITRLETSPDEAFVVADLSRVWPAVDRAKRGARLIDGRKRILLRDEVELSEPVPVWWFLHTRAAIALSADGREATLSSAGRRFHLQALEKDAVFSVRDARPFPESPQLKQSQNSGVRKLALNPAPSRRITLTVLCTPLAEGETPGPLPPGLDQNIDAWALVDRRDLDLAGLQVDGKELPGFSPLKFEYRVQWEGGIPPVVTARAKHPATAISLAQATAVPGTARITARNGARLLETLVRFAGKPVDPMEFPKEGRIPVVRAVASSSDENLASGAVDGDLNTRWSAEGAGQTLTCEFAAMERLDRVVAIFFKGGERSTSFEIAVSLDGKAWEKVLAARSRGAAQGAEIFPLGKPAAARFVRFTGLGNSVNAWNSVVELAFLRP
ncbi:MAG: discoidin domain-containing protein [Spirochaetes bacterium]|nr:discoidin domain-containing protein [Spirochaetota bacterium]